MDRTFTYEIYIATSPERVWAALTDGGITRQYWAGRQVESSWHVGAPVLYRRLDEHLDPIRGLVIEVDPPNRLVQDWAFHIGTGKPLTPATRVTFDIAPAGPHDVKLTLTHAPLEDGSVIDDSIAAGWPAILSSLKSFMETGHPLDLVRHWGESGA